MDMDYFYYYNTNNQDKEIQSNIEMHICQPKRTLFYYRECGSDVATFENNFISLITKILVKYSVVRALANMNSFVGNGTNGRDYRIITSQDLIDVGIEKNQIQIGIQYLPVYNTEQASKLEISLGGIL